MLSLGPAVVVLGMALLVAHRSPPATFD